MATEQLENKNSINNFSKEGFSNELKSTIDYMVNVIAKEYPTVTIDMDYFLLSILENYDSFAYKRIIELASLHTVNGIVNTFHRYLSGKSVTIVKPGRDVILSEDFIKAFSAANEQKDKFGSNELTSEHVILACLNESFPENNIRKIFVKAGVTYNIFFDKCFSSKYDFSYDEGAEDGSKTHVIDIFEKDGTKIVSYELKDNKNIVNNSKKRNKNLKSNTPNIDAYCTNLNNLAECGKIDPLIGRDNEIKQIIQILGKRKKNNVILVGSEGVGKTAIGESLAYKIINNDVPDFLIGKIVISLDMTALMAGTTLRGMFEDRVKGVIDEIKKNKSYVMFVDNIGEVFSSKKENDYDISSMFSQGLENGDFQVIGTSDFKTYRATFEKDASLSRRFQKILVEAPSVEYSIEILNGIKDRYEEFHHVKYSDDAISACVKLANKYVSERNLPDSAIDILDGVGSVIGTSRLTSTELAESINKKKEYLERIDELTSNENYTEADKVRSEMIEYNLSFNKSYNEFKKNIVKNPITITENDILSFVSEMTNIPINKLTVDDKERLVNMNDRLKSEIIGQDDAIDTICRALKRNRVGLSNNKCMVSALLVGTTGVGKTLLAKKLAKELFGEETSLIRFDMSEYPDKSSVNKLIGSNPGYVGYEEGGLLTNSIKNKKYCVLLIDEVEKADKDVYNIFLQVLDEGFLTDNSGMKVDFRNVVLIFTSNVGARQAVSFGKGVGFTENENENKKKILLKELKNEFPPEFINRLNSVIYFNELTDDTLKNIIKIELDKSNNRINNIGYSITYTDDVVNHLFDIVKIEKEYGARPVIRAIQQEIEDKVTDLLLENEYEVNHKFKVKKIDDEIVIE